MRPESGLEIPMTINGNGNDNDSDNDNDNDNDKIAELYDKHQEHIKEVKQQVLPVDTSRH